jgi:hypothetical protein
MNDSAFDPNKFLDTEQTEVNERRALLPVNNPDDPNGAYFAVIGEITTSSGVIGKGENAGNPWASMVIPLRLQIPAQLQETLGLPKELQLTDRAFLDLTPQGSLDNAKGKNRRQKDYRDATGENVPGKAFAWRMLQGRTVKVKITHEEYPAGSGVFLEKPGVILPA